jgi:hypothetical protein
VNDLLFVPETEAFDRVTLWEPACANMLVPVRGDDVLLVRRKDELGYEGGVSQDECSSRRVFMRREGVGVQGGHWCGCGCGQRREGVTRGDVSTEMVVIGRKRGS